jgi:hypothetical protein
MDLLPAAGSLPGVADWFGLVLDCVVWGLVVGWALCLVSRALRGKGSNHD